MTRQPEPRSSATTPSQGIGYGDYPYGLEPLILPPAGTGPHFRPRRSGNDSDPEPIVAVPNRTASELRSNQDHEQLFWFRWITGHQISFALWLLLADATRDGSGGETTASRDQLRPALLVRAYASMLLYTGSCSQEIYEQVIRPCMWRHHRWFSGVWAPDYVPVRGLLRGRWSPPLTDPAGAALAREVQLTTLVHDLVSRKLVPDGASFVAHASASNELRRASAPGLLYDLLFLTVRAPVMRCQVEAQLVRRVRVVLEDLAVNELYPADTKEAAARRARLWTSAVCRLERDLANVLGDLLTGIGGHVSTTNADEMGR